MTPLTWWLMAVFLVACDAHDPGIRRDNNDAGNNSAPGGYYRLTDSYNVTNFFDKFQFIESKTGTPQYSDVDPTNGFVLYQNRSEATRLGLVRTAGDVSIIGVDATTVIADPTGYGRKSVRLQSYAQYNHGLFIVNFSHLPAPVCGTWPAFWLNGPEWPITGEMDIYEQWNTHPFNRQTLHTGPNSTVGNCTYDKTPTPGLDTDTDTDHPTMQNHMHTQTCDVQATGNAGCSTWDYEGPFGSATGGVYAAEWTGAAIRMWAWHPGLVPADVVAGLQPDPSSWGAPGLVTTSAVCDIDAAFRDLSIVVNVAFCGDTAGVDWAADGCAARTGLNTCSRYVAGNPGAFGDVWFGVRSIAVYTLG